MDGMKKTLETLVEVQKSILERASKSEKMIRAVINGQSLLKSELLGEINTVDKKLTDTIDSLNHEVKKGFKEVNNRLDKQGKSLAYLEDDAPTIEEFDKLETRVAKLELQTTKN